jgi:hypothetical protein
MFYIYIIALFLSFILIINNFKEIKFYLILKHELIKFNLFQYWNKSVVPIGKNFYIISYVINSKLYKIIVEKPNGPPKQIQICDEKGNDRTHDILPFMGPMGNWKHEIDMDQELVEVLFDSKFTIENKNELL